jgi:ubiquinone/menaquinone biosynthesis C-methylase UbiE
MGLNKEQYKELSIREFTKAAAKYEGNHAGVYELCKKDYPDILEELEKEEFTDILDAGCGPAPMISLLAEKYPDRHYTGIDLTPASIIYFSYSNTGGGNLFHRRQFVRLFYAKWEVKVK